jgi:two-component system nitrate/nitrite response regulator NarL
LLEAFRSTPSCEGIEIGKIDQLSRREFQIAEHAAQGESNKQIADQLGLSEHTVKNYLFHVFEKLGVANRIELLLRAVMVHASTLLASSQERASA